MITVSEKSIYRYLKVMCAGMLLLFLVAALCRNWAYDELECIQSAWFIAQASAPYKNFFQHHHPLMYYVLSPFAYFFQPEAYLNIARLIAWACLAGLVILIVALGNLIFSQCIGVAAAAVFLSINIVAQSGFEVRPDTLQVLLAVAGTYCFFRFLIKKDSLSLYTSALLYSCSFLALQKSFPFFIFGFSALLHQWYYKKVPTRVVALWSCLLAFPILLYWMVLWIKGDWHSYWVCNYLFNAKLAAQFTFSDFVKGFLTNIFLPQLWLWFFCIVGLFVLKDFYLKLLTFIVVASLCAMRINGAHYWIVVLPYLSLITAYGLHSIFDKKRLILVNFLMLMLLPNIKWLVGNIRYGNVQQLSLLASLRSLSPSHQACYGDVVTCNFKRNADYFWYGYFQRDRTLFQQLLPEYVRSELDILQDRPAIIQVAKIKQNQKIKEFLRKNYTKSSVLKGVYTVQEKK